MSAKLFPTQDVGSLAKPRWRVKGFRGEALTENEIREALIWARKLDFEDVDELEKILRGEDSPERRRKILEWSSRMAIRFLEKAGLDIVFDGEMWRSEMYQHVISNIDGFEFLGWVKSFDYRYFMKAACISRPKYVKSFYLDEFLVTKRYATREIKVPFTGPYTLVDWSFNEFYEKKLRESIRDLRKRKIEARKEFLFDLIKEVLRPEIRKLVEAGAKWIQIDEPAATTNPTKDEMELFVEAFNELTKGINCRFSLHNCYSNYKVLAKYASELKNCFQLSLEFANRDSTALGTSDDVRKGYLDLKLFEEYGYTGNYGLGVIDVHTNFIESPELVRDRILYAVRIVGDPKRIYPSTDCGLRTRTWKVSFEKLSNLTKGAELARSFF